MSKRATTPHHAATEVRRVLQDGGSAKHAAGVQWFFKEEIKSHGWYTADLRRAAVRFQRDLRKDRGLDFLIEVADHLFSGRVLEEKVAAGSCWKGLTANSATASSSGSNPGLTASAVGRTMTRWFIP